MISVMMLTYNRESMVSRAIKSILDQTYKDFEFIIVDNGSTDNSGKIADEYAKKDSRIRVIHRTRGNISAGRNTAIDAAKGDHVAFVDDDDWVEPDYLEFLLDLIIENDADISICGANDKVYGDKCIMTAEQAVIEMLWRKKYAAAFPTKLFRKELWENLRFPEDASVDDIALMYMIMARANRVAYHGEPKYTFYKHDSNNSAWTVDHRLLDAKTLDEYLGCYRSRTEWLTERFPNSAPIFRYFEWSFMISMVEKIDRYDLKDCEKHLNYITSVLKEHWEDFLNCPEIQDFEKEWLYRYITV